MDYITLLSILIGFIALALYLKSPHKSNEENKEKLIIEKLNNDIKELTHQNGQNRQEINDLQKKIEISLTKVESFEELKMTKTQLEERLKNIENEKLDLVVLCTPSGLHAMQAEIVAKHNVNVITEKPMATRWHDGLRMVKSCDDAGVKLFVVKQNRGNRTLQLLKKAIKKARINGNR